MNQTPEPVAPTPLTEELSELSRLLDASRRDPQDIELQISYRELRARLPREWVAHFDSRRRSGRRAFAPLHSGICGACFTSQPLERQFAVGDGRLVRCPECGVAFVGRIRTVATSR